MKTIINFDEKRVEAVLKFLKQQITTEHIPLDGFTYCPTDYKKDTPPPAAEAHWETLNCGDRLSGVDKHFWIRKTFRTPPQSHSGRRIYFELKTGREGQWDALNPQGLVYLNGKAVQGMDINHTDVLLDFDTEYDFCLYFYTGMNQGDFGFYPALRIDDAAIEKLWYDLKVPFDGLPCLEEGDENAVTITKYLNMACHLLDLRKPYSDTFYASVAEADRFLEEEFYQKECGHSPIEISCIGHTHIDVAWLWTLAQTKEKAQRSFSTMLRLMEEYDDFYFMSSQPQLYQYVKENDPELYERIKEKIRQGRWEAEGAMWLEADCNLSSGESLVRQILFGKRFFRKEFDVESKVLWLPDVFGYSAALPQILKKSGVDKFVTSKISWNDCNQLPYDIFLWQGLDGTEIFTTFITAKAYDYKKVKGGVDRMDSFATYVGMMNPATTMGTRKKLIQKEYARRSLITFGYGDGGGGTTRDMMEQSRRLRRGLPGFPKTTIEPATQYLAKLEKDFYQSAEDLRKTPRWVGELYLELHRGTYTSQAKNKRNNRHSEFLLQTAEQLSSAASLLTGADYPQKELNDSWQTVLLNQFHDIIPGSSIKEVYEDCDRDYAKVFAAGRKAVDHALSALTDRIDRAAGTVVYNPNSFTATSTVVIDGKTVTVEDVPPMGWKTVTAATPISPSVSKTSLENRFYTITLDEKGEITSLYDKENRREVVLEGQKANVIQAFEDLPYEYDNWEISSYYKQKMWSVSEVTSIEPFTDGARAGLRIIRPFLDSVIVQEICLYENSRRIDFICEIDWKEEHILLKVAFPLQIHTDKATYETQFGYLERPTHENTSWDAAKFEVCAHKYADLSEDDYGVALLNDCKYGHNAEGSTLKLTLLKAGTYPDKNADKGLHRFTYSLLPHQGNHKQGGVVQEAYLLNRPFLTAPAKGDGSLPDCFSLVSCDCENVILETAKKAEDSSQLILRAYDAYNRKSHPTLTLGFPVAEAWLCDMMENPIQKLEVQDGNRITLPLSNFEIVTLAVTKQ